MSDAKSAVFRLFVAFLATILTAGPIPAQRLEAESVLVRLVDEVDVPARVAGVLSELNVCKGDSVDEGALLATIDDTEAQLLVQRAEIEWELARRKAAVDVAVRLAQRNEVFASSEYRRFQRAEEARPRSVSESELEEKMLQLDQAKLDQEKARHELEIAKMTAKAKQNELQLARHNVEQRRIVAPISGVVVEVAHEAGEWIEPGEKLLRIVRTDRLHAEGFVKANEIRADLIGAPVTLALELWGETRATFSGKLIFVSPEIDPVNNQVRVCAEIDNKQGGLRPGLRASMTIGAD